MTGREGGRSSCSCANSVQPRNNQANHARGAPTERIIATPERHMESPVRPGIRGMRKTAEFVMISPAFFQAISERRVRMMVREERTGRVRVLLAEDHGLVAEAFQK